MSAADRAALPREPLPPIIMARTAPALRPLDPAYTDSLARQCGAYDLVVPAGGLVTLSGTHRYEHICVAQGGVLAGRGTLTLIAQTIAIAPGGHLAVDGRSPLPFHWRDTGRYETHGACTADHSPVHRGTRGAAGMLLLARGRRYPGDTELEANPGEEGSALTLIARSVALGGLVTALGGTGQDAVTDFPERDALGPDSLGGGGGWSGGGIAIITHRLDVSGQLNVGGAEGGVGNGPKGYRRRTRERRLREALCR
jgi:hypothetical protein